MDKVKIGPTIDPGLSDYITVKLGTDTVANGGNLNDNDIGKPVKLVAADRYGLCADGDQIEGFLIAVDPATSGGYAMGTVQCAGRKRVELDGNTAIGAFVAAAAPAAAKTAETNGLGKVSTYAGVVGATATAAEVGVAPTITVSVDTHRWRLVSGTGLDEDTTAVIERC